MSARFRYEPAAPSAFGLLHIAGVGLRVDHVPAGALWERVQRQGPPDEEAPEPPQTLDRCNHEAGLFRSAALRAALTHRTANDQRGRFVENYPLPMLLSLPTMFGKPEAERIAWRRAYRAEVQWQLNDGPAAMAFHRLNPGAVNTEQGGAVSFQALAQAFDTQGDLNSMLLWAEDGYAARARQGGWEPPAGQPAETLEDILSRPKRPGQLRDVFSAVLFKRPEAAEWLREWSLHVIDKSDAQNFSNGVAARGPYGYGGLNRTVWEPPAYFDAPQSGFRPTPNVPEPWSRPQYEQYSQMPTLALMVPPDIAYFKEGMSTEQRAAALEAALVKVLQTPALRQRGPRRLFYSATADGDGAALLARGLARAAPQAGLLQPGAAFRLEQCLGGDLGAGTMGAALGLATIAVWETREPALVVNLRDSGGAVVCGLLPVNEDYRKRIHPRPYVI